MCHLNDKGRMISEQDNEPQLNYSISRKAINKTRTVKGSVVMFTCTLIYTCYLHLFISARVFNSGLTSLTVKLMPVFLRKQRIWRKSIKTK